jgi:ABC-type nitrate/sulfonate/bicarbonate transport system permease component
MTRLGARLHALMLNATAMSVLSPLALLVLWEIVFRLLPGRAAGLFTSPTQVVMALTELVTGAQAHLYGSLYRHFLTSLTEIALGFLAAFATAIPLGVAMGWSRWIERSVDPVVELLRPIPPMAWIPLSIFLLGIGLAQKTFAIFVAAFAPMLLNTVRGVKSIDRIDLRVAYTHNASQRDIVLKVLVPAVAPVIVVSARIGLGLAWMAVVAAEMVAAEEGLGFLLLEAYRLFRADLLVACMAIIGGIAYLIDRGIRSYEGRRLKWLDA